MKILIVLAFLIPVSVRAQSVFPDSSGPTSAGCYRLAVPPLTEAPPLHSDMNLSTLLGYLYLDSVMRSHITSAQWAAFDSIHSFDSLKYFLKYLYAITAYDPVLFEEYGNDAPFINPSYTGKPAAMVNYIEEKIGRVLHAKGDTTQMMYLTSASYILHIKVKNIFRDWDTLGHIVGGKGTPQACVEASILDTIKGQHILTGDCSWLYRIGNGHNGSGINDSTPTGACFHFEYDPASNKGGGGVSFVHASNDSVVFTGNSLGWDALHSDSEYIMFFNVLYEDYDGTNCYFIVRPIMDGEGGIYPVMGGNVLDPKNHWRMGTSVNLDAFESGLKNTIYKIQNP
jgi:hypothetical protein